VSFNPTAQYLTTVNEALHLVQQILEVSPLIVITACFFNLYSSSQIFDFLHDYRVAYMDIKIGNIGLNKIPAEQNHARSAYNPSVAQYTIFDFDSSIIFPPDQDVKTATCLDRSSYDAYFSRRPEVPVVPPDEPINPFSSDMAFVSCWLKEHTLVRATILRRTD